MTMPDGVGAADGRAQDLQSLVSEPDGPAEINGRIFSVRHVAQHEAPPPPLANVEQALAPLRNWRVGRATQHGVRGGATVGALIGGIVGTLLAPGVGTISFAYLGALAGAAVAGTAGWSFGEWRASRTTLQSLQQDVAPGTRKFDRLARSVGVDPRTLGDDAKQRMGTTLSSILESRARLGKRLTPKFVEGVQTALIRLEGKHGLDPDDRQHVHKKLREALNGWAVDGTRVDAALIRRAVDALAFARQAANATMPRPPAAGSRRASEAALPQDLARPSGVPVLGQDRSARLGLARAGHFVDPADWRLASSKLDETVLERAQRSYPVDGAFARSATAAFAHIATSAGRGKDAATDHLHEIMVGSKSLEPAVLQPMAGAFAKIGRAQLDANRRAAAMDALKTAVDLRLLQQLPIDATFLDTTGDVSIQNEQPLREAGPQANQRPGPGRRAERHAFLESAVKTADKNGVPLARDARQALLDALAAIGASEVSDERRADILKTFEGAINEHLYLRKPADADFVERTRRAAVLADTVLAQARPDQDRHIDRPSMAALKESYWQIVSARLQVGRPMSREELQGTLERLKSGMAWAPPDRVEEVAPLKDQARGAAEALVATLLKEDATEADLVTTLQSAYTSSARHTMARRELGLTHAGHQDNGPRGAKASEIRKDLLQGFVHAVQHRMGGDQEGAQKAYQRLMGDEGKARALLIAAGMLGSSHALRSQEPPTGVRASAELYGGLPAEAPSALEPPAPEPPERAMEDLGCLAMAMVALGRQAGARPEQEIEALHQAAARVFDPEQKARAVLDQLWKQVPPGVAALTTFEEFADNNRKNARYLEALQIRVDPQAPELDENDWKALAPAAQRDALAPDAQRRALEQQRRALEGQRDALERARDAILENWPDAQAEFTGVLHVTEGLGDAALLRAQAAGPQALPQLGADVAIVHGTDLKRDDASGDDSNDEKGDRDV